MPCSGAMVRDTTALIASDPNLRRCGKDAIAKMPTRLGCALPGAGGAMTDEGRHEHLDRRGNSGTCHAVVDAFDDADRHPDAPSTRSDLRQGEPAAPKGVIAGWRKAFRPHAPAARPTTA